MDANTVVALWGGLLCLEEKKRKPRKTWCKNWLKYRNRLSHMTLLAELAANEPNDFKNYLRMTEVCFEDILGLISTEIDKKDTNMRESISCKERLAVTLQFLASGRSYENLKFSCAISPQSLGKIIPETCNAIYNALRDEYLAKTKLWYYICQREIPSWALFDLLDNMFPCHWKDQSKVSWEEVYKCWYIWSNLREAPVTVNKICYGITEIASVKISGEWLLISSYDGTGKLSANRFSGIGMIDIYVGEEAILNFELVNSDEHPPSNVKRPSEVEKVFESLEHNQIWLESEVCYVQLGRTYCYTVDKTIDTLEDREQRIRHSYGYEVRLVDESLAYDPVIYLRKTSSKVAGLETMKIDLPDFYTRILDFWKNTVSIGSVLFPHQLIVSSVTVNMGTQEASHSYEIGHAYAVANTFVYSWHGSLYVLYSYRDVIIAKDGVRRKQATPLGMGLVTSVLFYAKHLFFGTERGQLLIYAVKSPEDCLNVVVYETPSWNIQVCQGEIHRIAVAEPVHHKGKRPIIVCATKEDVHLVSIEDS